MATDRSRLCRLNDRSWSVPVAGWSARTTWWGWDASKAYRIGMHAHREWEAVLVVGGHGWFNVGGRRQAVAHGDLMVSRPGEAHAIELDRRRPLAILFVRFVLRPQRDDPLGLAGLLADPAPTPLACDPGLAACFDLLAEEVGEPVPLAVEPMIQILLGRILRRWSGRARDSDGPLARAERLIEDQLHRALAVTEIARAAGLGERAFARVAVAGWGRTPLQEVMERRIARARLLLAEGRTLAETAALTGFPGPRHFIATFRRRTGLTPGRWQRVQTAESRHPGAT